MTKQEEDHEICPRCGGHATITEEPKTDGCRNFIWECSQCGYKRGIVI